MSDPTDPDSPSVKDEPEVGVSAPAPEDPKPPIEEPPPAIPIPNDD